jgi:hypothetical protein
MLREWNDLQNRLQMVQLTDQRDVVSWGLTPSKQFSSSSLYKFMTSGGGGSVVA